MVNKSCSVLGQDAISDKICQLEGSQRRALIGTGHIG